MRLVNSGTIDGPIALVGTPSPCAQFNTEARSAPSHVAPVASPKSDQGSARSGHETAHWSDQQWAVIILCGFTLFAVIIAMLIQQVTSLSA